MKELVVISGKGGTGKTSLTACLAALAPDKIIVDADVDAADLHLILQPQIQSKQTFYSGYQAIIRQNDCIGCGACLACCRFRAVSRDRHGKQQHTFKIDPLACEGCGLCVRFCPVHAIDFPTRITGQWFVSETRHGSFVHARLDIGAENSGKLVTAVRHAAKELAEKQQHDLILIDGPPGIGCPTIAALTGTTHALIVIEPTPSGKHDFQRIAQLTRHFKIKTFLCINKADLNPPLSDDIENFARTLDIDPVARIPYDPVVTRAQMQGKAVLEMEPSSLTDIIHTCWENLCRKMN